MKTQRTRRPYGRPVTVLGMVALMILMAAGGVLASHQFSDVPDDHPFHDEIGWMADAEITGGFADGTFRPTNPVTRMAMAAFMMRLAGHDPDVDPMVLAQHALEADWAEIAEWAEEAGHAEVADWAAAADWADEAGDAEQLGGIDAEEYITDSGFNRTSVSGASFQPFNPDTATLDRRWSQRADWILADGVARALYAHPDLDVQRFGETQYLHTARVCMDASDPDTIVNAVHLEVYETGSDGEQTRVHQESETGLDFGGDGCVFLGIDLDPDTEGSAQGFELGVNDVVNIWVQVSGIDSEFSTKSVHVNTSAREFRTTLIIIDPIFPFGDDGDGDGSGRPEADSAQVEGEGA